MEELYINWLAVLLAGLASIVIGSVWYAPAVFGKMWAKLAKVDEKKLKKGDVRPFVVAVLLSLLAAFVIAHVAALTNAFFGVEPLSAALSSAFWLWLGISLTTVVVHDMFEARPWKLTFITVGHQFFLMMAMGLIIGLIGGF